MERQPLYWNDALGLVKHTGRVCLTTITFLCTSEWCHLSVIARKITRNSIVFSMMTSSNGNIFRVTGHLCGEFTGPRWIPHTKASDAELWCFFDLRLNKRLSKQSWGWWFETLSCPLWRHRNEQLVQAKSQKASKFRITGFSSGKSTGDRWIHLTQGQ